jgi:glycosyltransferase involved in cell wall biosynthesis
VNKRVALVVPCFNEENRLPIEYWREIVNMKSEISWIFVNDGSSDRTIELLNRIVQGTDSKIIECDLNLGKGNAIRLGLLHALSAGSRSDVLGYIDADGAFSKEDIMSLVKLAVTRCSDTVDTPIDAILSSRVSLAGHDIKRKSSRHYLGRLIATFLTRDWEEAPYDTQSGFKIFRNSDSFQNALTNEFKTRWFVDIELLTRIGIRNCGKLRIWEEPLTSWRDVSGSKITITSFPKLLAEILIARREVSHLIEEGWSKDGSN